MTHLRAFRPQDSASLLAIRAANAAVDAEQNANAGMQLQNDLRQGSAAHNLWVIEQGQEILAYGGLRPWHSLGWLQVEVFVHPAWRNRGLGSMLLEQLLAEAARRGAPYVGTTVSDRDAAAGAFLRRHGFDLFVPRQHMRLQPIIVPPAPAVAGYWLREARASESTQLALLTNRVYSSERVGRADGPGYRLYMEQTGARVWVVERLGEGQPVGLCEVRAREITLGGATVQSGHIASLGIHPERRGLGLGRWLLACGIRQCLENRWPTVELNVDRDNEPALRLYTSVGFKPVYAYNLYRREVKRKR